jgi:hypothetical protein
MKGRNINSLDLIRFLSKNILCCRIDHYFLGMEQKNV